LIFEDLFFSFIGAGFLFFPFLHIDHRALPFKTIQQHILEKLRLLKPNFFFLFVLLLVFHYRCSWII